MTVKTLLQNSNKLQLLQFPIKRSEFCSENNSEMLTFGLFNKNIKAVFITDNNNKCLLST